MTDWIMRKQMDSIRLAEEEAEERGRELLKKKRQEEEERKKIEAQQQEEQMLLMLRQAEEREKEALAKEQAKMDEISARWQKLDRVRQSFEEASHEAEKRWVATAISMGHIRIAKRKDGTRTNVVALPIPVLPYPAAAPSHSSASSSPASSKAPAAPPTGVKKFTQWEIDVPREELEEMNVPMNYEMLDTGEENAVLWAPSSLATVTTPAGAHKRGSIALSSVAVPTFLPRRSTTSPHPTASNSNTMSTPTPRTSVANFTSEASELRTARPSEVGARLGFVLPGEMGEFRYAVKGRVFRALRRFDKVIDANTIMPVALVTCNDIAFLCHPGATPADPMVLLHLPSQRCDIRAELVPDGDPSTFRVHFAGKESHMLESTSEKEAQFWVRTINAAEGYVKTADLGKL